MSRPVPRARYSPVLEAVRGIAILLVVVYHVTNLLLILRERASGQPLSSSLALGPPLEVSPLAAFADSGHTGVTLFFVLSAFLLSRPFLNERGNGPAVEWTSFWRRRALRILPAYYVAVIVAVIMTSAVPAQWLRAVPYLLFANSWPGVVDPILPYSAVWWSLATEVQFYLLLPIAFGILRLRGGGIALGMLLLVYGSLYAYFGGRPVSRSFEVELVLRHSLLGRAPAFLFGILAAWVEPKLVAAGERQRRSDGAEPAATQSWASQLVVPIAILGCLACLGVLLSKVAAVGYYIAELRFHYWHVCEAALWAAFILLVRRLRGPLHDVLCNRALQGLGLVSYSVYLVHFSLIYFLGEALDQRGLLPQDVRSAAVLPFLALTLAGSVALSTLTYRVIERPFLRRKRRARKSVDAT